MKIAFSNIAWNLEEDAAAFECLLTNDISCLEAAPLRLWQNIENISQTDALATKAFFKDKGFSISGFQAILFGQPQLQLFEKKSREALFSYLTHIADLCSAVGGKYLVFGAPKNRWLPENLPPQEAFEVAKTFFKELGIYAVKKGVVFGIEANPADYGCNFCTTIKEVIDLIKGVDSPGIRWHLDTGEMAMNKENIPYVIESNSHLIGSVHISEPFLNGFETPWKGHQIVAAYLKKASFQGALSIEMKRQPSGLAAVEQAVHFVSKTYF